MLNIFEATTTSETDLYPNRDPDVLACQAACDAAQDTLTSAQQALNAYCELHPDAASKRPYPRPMARLYDDCEDAQQVAEEAGIAHRMALETATAKAVTLWNARIRQEFLDDQSVIEAFVVMLERHERTLLEAQTALRETGGRPLNVPNFFMTAQGVREMVAATKKAMGVE